jgi:hypothetical protein
MACVIKRSGRYDYRIVEHDNDHCKLEFTKDGKPIGESSFTMGDAQKADLHKGDNWRHYPRNMLFARALSNGANWYCPELFGGNAAYTPDELGAIVNAEGDAVIDATSTPVAPRKSFAELQAEAAGGSPQEAAVITVESAPFDAEGERLVAEAEGEHAKATEIQRAVVEAVSTIPFTPAEPEETTPPNLVGEKMGALHNEDLKTNTDTFAERLVALGYREDEVFRANVQQFLSKCGAKNFSGLTVDNQRDMLKWLGDLVQCQSLAFDLGYTEEKIGAWLKGRLA